MTPRSDRLDGEVSLAVRDGVAVLSLRRPAARNALRPAMVDTLRATVDRVGRDSAVRCLVLRGDGPAFCAGGDIHHLHGREAAAIVAYNRGVLEVADAIEDLPFPSIAAVGGAALGGGLELALACSLRIAGHDARLGLPEVRGGTIPAAGGLARLPCLVGPGAAARLVLVGRPVGAAEALRLGLVDEIAPAGALDAVALERAGEIAAGAPLAVRAAWAALREGGREQRRALARAAEERLERLAATADFAEGMRAFVERRPPRFAGR